MVELPYMAILFYKLIILIIHAYVQNFVRAQKLMHKIMKIPLQLLLPAQREAAFIININNN